MNGYPRLYIGRAAQELKKRVNFPIYQVSDSSLSEFISYYSSITKKKDPLVIEDITYLNIQSQSKLLKFIEDTELKIILLSSDDNIIHTILSRMSLVYKVKETVTSQFLPFLQAKEELDKIDPDTHYLTYIKKEMQLSPISYYYNCLVTGKSNKDKDKLLQLLQ